MAAEKRGIEAVELVDLDVILLFQNVSGWRLWKMVRDLDQRQQRISYIWKRSK
jgi:hypothetical protein